MNTHLHLSGQIHPVGIESTLPDIRTITTTGVFSRNCSSLRSLRSNLQDTGASVSEEDVVDKRDASCKVEDAPTLQRRAVWCGVVCSLALVLTVLNIFPPSRVRYHVRSEVVVSQSRIARIAENIAKTSNPNVPATLTQLNVLDDKTQDVFSDLLADSGASHTRSALVELQSLWNSRCDDQSHENWLTELTRVDPSELASTDVAREKRMSAWEATAAEHYMRRHEYLSNRSPLSTSTDGRVFELATNAAGKSARETEPAGNASQGPDRQRQEALIRGVPAQLASYAAPAGDSASQNSTSNAATQSEIRELLEKQLLAASEKAKTAEAQWHQAANDAAGAVHLATKPEVRPLYESIPTVSVMSVLILGTIGALGAAMLFRFLQCSGVHSPAKIAAELSLQGLPTAGTVELAHFERDDDAMPERFGRVCAYAGKWMGRNMITVGEVVMGCWALLAVGRCLLDPIWRAVLMESPLIALSHLWIGMP